MNWTDHANADPIADLRAWSKKIAEASGLSEPHRHMFYGERGLRAFLVGDGFCVGCGLNLDKFGDRLLVCHPDDLLLPWVIHKALEERIAVRPDDYVAQGQPMIVDFGRILDGL